MLGLVALAEAGSKLGADRVDSWATAAMRGWHNETSNPAKPDREYVAE